MERNVHKLKSHIRKECVKNVTKVVKINVCLKGLSTVSRVDMNCCQPQQF